MRADSARPISASSDTTACSSACTSARRAVRLVPRARNWPRRSLSSGRVLSSGAIRLALAGSGSSVSPEVSPRSPSQRSMPAMASVWVRKLVGPSRRSPSSARFASVLRTRCQPGCSGAQVASRAIAASSAVIAAFSSCAFCSRLGTRSALPPSTPADRPRCCCVLRMTAKPASKSSRPAISCWVTRISPRKFTKICVSRIAEAAAQTRMIRPNLSG